jgi:hypothetical protein
MRIIDRTSTNAEFDYKSVIQYSNLALVVQLGIPLIIILDSMIQNWAPLADWLGSEGYLCPGLTEFEDYRRASFWRGVPTRLTILPLTMITFLGNWTSVRFEERAYRFLATFEYADSSACCVYYRLLPSACQHGLAQWAAGVKLCDDCLPPAARYAELHAAARGAAYWDRDIEVGQLQGSSLLFYSEMQGLSFKLIFAALICLFLNDCSVVDIVLNCLALQFVVDLDNLMEGPVQASEIVTNEMRQWFDNYDWYSPKMEAYLTSELNQNTFTMFGVDFPELRVPLLPMFRFAACECSCLVKPVYDPEWVKQPWFKQALSFLDIWFFCFVTITVAFGTVCIKPQLIELGDVQEQLQGFCEANPKLNGCLFDDFDLTRR